jgi:hypothetical protein
MAFSNFSYLFFADSHGLVLSLSVGDSEKNAERHPGKMDQRIDYIGYINDVYFYSIEFSV